MTTPRSREEIVQDMNIDTTYEANKLGLTLIIEVLLDIRDLLTKKNPTDL